MPIKEFKCGACAHRFEVLLMLDEPDPASCPKCGAGGLDRLLSTFRIAGVQSKSARKEDGLPDTAGAEAMGGMDGMDAGMDGMGGVDGMGEDDMDAEPAAGSGGPEEDEAS